MASPLPFQSLDDNPRQHFAEFERQVYDDAGSSCVDIFPHGLLSLVVSDTIWQELPDNTTITNGVATTIDRNTFPPPNQPADNATSGLWKSFEARRKSFDLYNAATQTGITEATVVIWRKTMKNLLKRIEQLLITCHHLEAPPTNLSWGEGSGIRNPCGNHWTVSVTRVVEVDGT